MDDYNNEKPIGIFDSGLGGLTVLKEIRNLLPHENLIYFGDSGRAPYGTKSTETVQKFTRQDIWFLLSKGVKAIVVACNTAAACTGREMLDSFGIPVIDVIGAGSEEASRVTTSGKIGVIGTQATVKSGVYEKAIRSLAPGCEFHAKACPMLVPLVEEGLWEDEVTKIVCRRYLEDFGPVDTLVLGCTHYPYLEKIIREIVGDHVTLVNSAKAVAMKLKNVLRYLNLEGSLEHPTIEYYTSDSVEKFTSLGSLFLGDLDGTVTHTDPEKF